MQPLISTQLSEDAGPDSRYPHKYPDAPPIDLTDLNLFRAGPPIAAFHTMRERSPVCWHPGNDTKAGFWALTRHADIISVSRDPATFSSQKGGIHILAVPKERQQEMLAGASLNNMICMDGGWHKHMRDGHTPFFSPDAVTKLKKKVEHKVDALLDDMAPLGQCDMVEKFSAELPLFTLSEILGIPEADRPKLVRWMHYLEIANYLGAAGPEAAEASGMDMDAIAKFVAQLQQNIEEMFEFGRFMLYSRRKEQQPDLLNAIAWAQLEESLLNEQYLDGSWLLIVFAGNDTTRNTLSGTVKLLTDNPDQRQLVLDDPSLMPNMVEESIRMISPVQHMRRTATCDTELGGQQIAEGEKVVMWYNAGNRDPEVFDEPDSYDIRRHNANRHISFGFGQHTCIGNRVARMQLDTAYRKILQRLPDIELDGAMKIAPNNFVYAISKLPVRFTPN